MPTGLKKLIAAFAVAFFSVASLLVWSTPAAMGSDSPAETSRTTTLVSAIEVRAGHPRILVTPADVERIRSQTRSNADQASLLQSVLDRADVALTEPVSKYQLADGVRLLKVSRAVLDRALNLGMAYLVTADNKYAERLRKEVMAAAAFPNWNPNHFLDTAEMSTAVAIALDWTWGYLSESDRATLTNALVQKGIEPALAVYRADPTSVGPYANGGNWSQLTNNWNIVVNSGVGIAALAVWDERSSVATTALDYSRESIRRGLTAYGPDGGFAEGPTYWEYATRYLTSFITALRSATGVDFGIADAAGVSQTGYFPLRMTGPMGTSFAFGDSDPGSYRSAALVGLGSIFGDSHLTYAGVKESDGTNPALRLAWYNPSAVALADRYDDLPFDGNLSGAAVATLRSSWTDPDAIFTGIRTGVVASAPHQNRDAGTFVLGALGQTWATELGKDDYSLQGYFDSGSGGARWDYYRERPEGQNTLAITPFQSTSTGHLDDHYQNRFETDDLSGLAVANLDEVYQGVSWSRGLRLTDDRGDVILQDEVSVADGTFDAMWTMHTAAHVLISTDGKSARLFLGGEELVARITSPGDLRFAVMGAEALPTSPQPTQASNATVQKLVIVVSARSSLSLTVQFTPVLANTAGTAISATPLAQWSASAGTAPTVLGVSVGGAPIDHFDPRASSYVVSSDPTRAVPTVTATSAAGYTTTITQASAATATATVAVADSTGSTRLYKISFRPSPTTITSVVASYTKSGRPLDTIDRDRSTYWATWGNRSITWDLGTSKSVESLEIDWKQNGASLTKFEVLVSVDNIEWAQAYQGELRGKGEQSVFAVPAAAARFVRLDVHGDGAVDLWSAVREVRIYSWDVTKSVPVGAVWVPPGGRFTISGLFPTLTTTETADISYSLPTVEWSSVSLYSSDASVVRTSGARTVEARGAGVVRVGALQIRNGVVRSGSVEVSVVDPTKVVLSAGGDSYVQGGETATQNFGSQTSLLVKPTRAGWADGSMSRYSYAWFDVSSLQGVEIVSATLSVSGTLTDSLPPATARVDVHTTAGSWTESGVTFANRPTFGPTIASATYSKTKSTQTMDVTAGLREQLAAGKSKLELGFTEDDPEGGIPLVVRLDSRESTTPPTLQITIKPAG